jgi:hypothetical protein
MFKFEFGSKIFKNAHLYWVGVADKGELQMISDFYKVLPPPSNQKISRK